MPTRLGGTRLAPIRAFLAFALAAPPLHGQFDASNVVPNYDRIRVGQVEGLEGGAYVARTGDGGANWYNPAGLALASGTALNASANAYEFTTVRLAGLAREFSSGRFQSLGTYFAGVIGSPILTDSRFRLGFSFTHPLAWAPGTVSGTAGELETGIAGETLDFYSKVEMTVAIPAIAAGYRLTDRFRVGIGVGMPVTTLKIDNNFTNRLIAPTAGERTLRTTSIDGQMYQFQVTGGVQWDLSDVVRVGATVTSPGMSVGGTALLGVQNVEQHPEGTVDLSLRDPKADFEYLLPLRVVGGVAATFGRFEVEADVRFHGSRGAFDLLATDIPVTSILTDQDGTTSVVRESLPATEEEVSSVTNLALGGNFALSDSWRLHGGIFTDNSPIGDPETSQFQAVDLMGAALAVSFGGQLSGTIGVSSSWGTTEERSFGPSLGGVTGLTTLEIQTFNLHYALSFTFD